jgi:spermidine synthase
VTATESPRIRRLASVERSARTRLYLLFCLSGFVGVLAEQVFEKLLSVVVGASTPAAATVLAVYFLGLSIGGYLASVLMTRGVPALLGYAAAELGVALCCASLLLFFDPGAGWYSGLLAWGGEAGWRLASARAIVASTMILPTAICLGLSFPFLSSVAARVEQNAAYYLAKLYFSNLLGAAVCALAAPFLIFPFIGLSGALLVCVATDLAVAFYAWRLSGPIASASPVTIEKVQFRWEGRDAMILGIAFVSGLVFFALEVIWTHLVGVVIGTSVYAFSLMLFVVLLGLGIGCMRIARKTHLGAPPVRLYALFFLCASAMFVQVALWRFGPEGILRLGRFAYSFYAGEVVRLTVLLVLLLPATYAFGMIYPSLFQENRFERRGAGVLIGYMTGANAMGCVLGAALATFVLIPRVGSEWSLRWITVALTLCGIAVLWVERDWKNLRQAFVAAPMLAVMVLGIPGWDWQALTCGANVNFGHVIRVASAANNPVASAAPDSFTTKLIFFHEHSYGGVTTIIENRDAGQPPRHVLLTNGKFQGDDSDQQDAQIAFALIPAIHLKNRGNALVIGCGTGQSASVLNALDFRTVDLAEISPGILLAAGGQFSSMNENVLRSPKLTVHLEDGRNVLLARPTQYDQITIELTSVWFAGATNLYSREFYELAKRRLKPGGVFQQWYQLHHISPREVESIMGTLRATFPYVSAWLFGGQGVLLATMEPQQLQPGAVATALGYLRRHSPDEKTAQRKMNDVLASQLLDPTAITRLATARSPIINTDWNRWIEFSTPRYNLTETDWMAINRRNLESFAVLTGRR